MSQDLAALQERSFARATAATATSYPLERRLSGEQLADYLDRRSFAVVSTTRPNGKPHTALSLFFRDGTTFWLPTVSGSVRERNIRHQPWADLVVAENDHPEHVAVLIEGPAAAVALTDAPERIRSQMTSTWAKLWLTITAERLLSYADQDANV